jgi:hypothetical protein
MRKPAARFDSRFTTSHSCKFSPSGRNRNRIFAAIFRKEEFTPSAARDLGHRLSEVTPDQERKGNEKGDPDCEDHGSSNPVRPILQTGNASRFSMFGHHLARN